MTITSLSDDSREARLCNAMYDVTRKQFLSAHPWNFAIGRIQIASDASLPSGWDDDIWDYSFTLGSDVLRVLSIDDEEAEWAVEGGKLFCNYTPVKIKYIKDVTNTALFSAFFERALAHVLAMNISYGLTQSASMVAGLEKLTDLAVREARSFDAQEGGLLRVQATDYLNIRK
jgi:hypothetical protein